MIQPSATVTSTCPVSTCPVQDAFSSSEGEPEDHPAVTATFLSGNIYIYDLVDQCNLSGSCSVAKLLGHHTDDVIVNEPLDLACLIHPDDLNRVAEHFQRFNTLRHAEVISIEYRMWGVDNRWYWLRSHETPLLHASDGFPLQILGIIRVVEQA